MVIVGVLEEFLEELFAGIHEECRVLVVVAMRVHLFPFRTQKLSSSALMIVGLNSRESKSPPRPCISQERNTKTQPEGCVFSFTPDGKEPQLLVSCIVLVFLI